MSDTNASIRGGALYLPIGPAIAAPGAGERAISVGSNGGLIITDTSGVSFGLDKYENVITGVNLMSVASTAIVPAKAGKRFLPLRIWAIITTKSGTINGDATANIGGSTGGAIAQTLTVGQGTFDFGQEVTEYPVAKTFDVSASALNFNVTTAATGTGGPAFVASLFVSGWYMTLS